MMEEHDRQIQALRDARGEVPPTPPPKRRPPAAPSPEGVALYRCDALHDDIEGAMAPSRCGHTAEAKPYLPIPWHHGRPMTIVGYDWDRDVE